MEGIEAGGTAVERIVGAVTEEQVVAGAAIQVIVAGIVGCQFSQ